MNMCNLIRDFYSRMGLWNDVWVSLSVRDYEHPEKYIGEQSDWDICEQMVQEVSDELHLDAKRCEGEAALYGPKLDFMFKDALGREIQIPTVQLDFAMPKRFDLNYIDENGEKQHPVMVHRAVLGSYERFLVLLLEQFKGVLPIWLSPVQVNIVPVNVRVEYDNSKESMGKKVRQSNVMKNPITIIIGDNERDNNLISFRKYNSEETISMSNEEFIKLMENL
ncbi:MAG: His/Gly/Thr/Pro-type tRNA ligase C-terminal domain-containing protein [bacterium]|nr:His/Gly/Thr/Pro-type tRNA ligase C-terminal domain-containing protein [bacterium]